MTTDLYTIARVCGGTLAPGANGARRVCGFYTDSRTAEKEKIFLAIKGEHFDGNSFAGALVQGGHAAIVSEPSAAVRGDVILVRDVRAALLTLARYYRENVISGVKVVGVTGSVGKTTTKEMIALALSATEKVFKTPGNANSLLGLPISLLSVPEDADAAVLEMGINQPGEMERLSSAAMPDISVVTNIGHSHIEFFGTREAICAEKLRVASHSAPGSKILLCTDEPLLAGRESVYGARVVAVSAASTSAYAYATDVVDTANGLSFTAHIGGGEYPVSLPAGGRHFLLNTLDALAVCALSGADVSAGAKALCGYRSDGKRQYIYTSGGHTVISDCYNASPESVAAALSVLSKAGGRRIAVLGDMLELGASAGELHREVGRDVAGNADVLVTYGTLARFIAETAAVPEVYSFAQDDRAGLTEFLSSFVKPGDTVLYKASNGMRLSELII